jgi:hypothetical protein
MVEFNAENIITLGWRQGAVLDDDLARQARNTAPPRVQCADDDWLILTSHDCDVTNFSLAKEPVVEILRAVVIDRKNPDGQLNWGRNPRTLHVEVDDGSENVVLQCSTHDRWSIPREMLLEGKPARFVSNKVRRLIAEWLAKRYIRSAFPSEFDRRWRGKGSRNLKQWTELLAKHRDWIQGVYLRLNTLNELKESTPYRCHLIVAVPVRKKSDSGWAGVRNQIEQDITAFWKSHSPSIVFDGCEVLGTDEVTLADIDLYQRFDADWLSFADDGDATPPAADMTS